MRSTVAVLFAAVVAIQPAAAQPAGEPVADAIAAARQAYAEGALLNAAEALRTALDGIHQRLAEVFVPLMPPAPEGWQGYDAQADAMGIAGGGMAVMKGYDNGEATLNASLIVDSEAVGGIADMLANPAALGAQPGMSLVRLDAGPALMRWDGEDRSGEIMMVLGDSLLLQVVGSDLESSDVLVGMMRSWDVAAIRERAGL